MNQKQEPCFIVEGWLTVLGSTKIPSICYG